jgi:hypothetical protein
MTPAGRSPGQGQGMPPRLACHGSPPVRLKTPRSPPSCMPTSTCWGAPEAGVNWAVAQ